MPQIAFSAGNNVHDWLETWIESQDVEVTKAAAARYFLVEGIKAKAPWLIEDECKKGNDDDNEGDDK